MRRQLSLGSLLVLPQVAEAHPGHIAEVAGHGHWVAGAAIGAAVVIGLLAGLMGKRAGKTEASEQDASEDASSDGGEPDTA